MDDWDPDDYEHLQRTAELVGPEDDWIEQQLGDRSAESGLTDAGSGAHSEISQASPDSYNALVLKYSAVCASCHERMAVGEDAVVQRVDGRWLKWHPGHEDLSANPTVAVPDLEPGERFFPLQYAQACGRCGSTIGVGDEVVGRKLDRGWAVRHPSCNPPGEEQPVTP
jgi:hypothetical protein